MLAKASKPKKNARVQFGSPQAAEYDIDEPSGKLTPLPSELIRERYSMEEKVVTEAEEEITQETKQNSALLAEWEDEFEDDDDDEIDSSNASRASHARRNRKNRRSSSIFMPSPDLRDEDQDNADADFMTPNEVEAPSPSVVVMENLASLRMSPLKSDSQPIHTAQFSPSMESEDLSDSNGNDNSWLRSSDSDLSPSSDQSTVVTSPANIDTAELVMKLDSIHTTGGAMDLTPPSAIHRTSTSPRPALAPPSSSSSELTPPPTNVSLDTIHSFGGALDDSESPNTSSLRPSPITLAKPPSIVRFSNKDSPLSPIPTLSKLNSRTRNDNKAVSLKIDSGVSLSYFR